MGEFQKQFEIKKVIEREIFQGEPARAFFVEWCRANDSIIPKFIPRPEWEARGGISSALEKNEDNTRTLFIPEDLHLWEIIGFVEVVDRDTFEDSSKKSGKREKKLKETGSMFRNAGIYLAERLDSIKKGKEIAQMIAEEFHTYGDLMLQRDGAAKDQTLQDAQKDSLTPEEVEQVDKWLAGEQLYASRRQRAETQVSRNNGDLQAYLEEQRCKTLSQFFRVSEKAFSLQQKQLDRSLQEEVKPWSMAAPIHSSFLRSAQEKMQNKVGVPERELYASILDRGLETLYTGMKTPGWRLTAESFLKKMGTDVTLEERRLVDTLDIPKLRAELTQAREEGNQKVIVDKEKEIAAKIRVAIHSFPFLKEGGERPAVILEQGGLQCVGATLLMSKLFDEVGLSYCPVVISGHSLILQITNEHKVYWQDPGLSDVNPEQSLFNGREIRGEDIRGKKKNGQPVTVADIVNLSEHKINGSVSFRFFDQGGLSLSKALFHLTYKFKSRWMHVSSPEQGLPVAILHNVGLDLHHLGQISDDPEKKKKYLLQALHAFRETAVLDTEFHYLYDDIQEVLGDLADIEEDPEGKKHYLQEASVVLQQFIRLDPECTVAYYKLGEIFEELGDRQQAIECYEEYVRRGGENIIEKVAAKKKIAELRSI